MPEIYTRLAQDPSSHLCFRSRFYFSLPSRSLTHKIALKHRRELLENQLLAPYSKWTRWR